MGKAFPARYVVKSAAGWRYRRVVPKDCRDKLGRLEWVVSFAPGTPIAKIEARAERYAAAHDALIRRARGGEVLDASTIAKIETEAKAHIAEGPDWRDATIAFLVEHLATQPNAHDAAFINALRHDGHYRPDVVTLAMVREKRGGSRSEKPIDAALATFAAHGDKDVREITRADVAEWITAELARGMKPRTVKRQLSALHAIIARAFLDLEVAKPNPFSGHADLLKGARASASDRLPFNRAMLTKIDLYLATSRRLRETRDILRIMRNTGCGPAEVGGLVLSDVSLSGDVPFIWISNQCGARRQSGCTIAARPACRRSARRCSRCDTRREVPDAGQAPR